MLLMTRDDQTALSEMVNRCRSVSLNLAAGLPESLLFASCDKPQKALCSYCNLLSKGLRGTFKIRARLRHAGSGNYRFRKSEWNGAGGGDKCWKESWGHLFPSNTDVPSPQIIQAWRGNSGTLLPEQLLKRQLWAVRQTQSPVTETVEASSDVKEAIFTAIKYNGY